MWIRTLLFRVQTNEKGIDIGMVNPWFIPTHL
jgi:hypothetical protein